ncbi:DUF4268 domain-containing protein [Candidatus Poribacteria bacterium]|nr:DUF4268 domain-containing protein [Candidatus Poribacteria bacterium]
MNFFSKDYDLEQYTEDFKVFMEKSHLKFWKISPMDAGAGFYIGYEIRPRKRGIWLYAMVTTDKIAAALRVTNEKYFEALKAQAANIQPYFQETLECEYNRIGITKDNIDSMDSDDRIEQFYFLRKTLETLDLTFRDRIENLD